MRHFRIALRFMTRYPVGSEAEFISGDFGRATGYFPLVGFLIGLDLMLLRYLILLDKVGLHYPLSCFLLLLFWVWSGDSLHLDGLADTADALASRKEGTEFSEVLHDSRVGAFGSAVIALALLAKFVWLYSLPMQAIWFFPLPFVFSRLHSSLACQVRPYAGKTGSLSSLFIEESRHDDLNPAFLCSLGAFFAVSGLAMALGMASVTDAALALAICAGGMLLGRVLLQIPMRRLGGISGDLIGWSQVIVEVAVAFGLTLVLVQ